MKDSDYICKHCGSDDIVAQVEVTGRREIGGRLRDRSGKPEFIEDMVDLDYDITEYVCECGHSHWKLEELVVRRRAYNEMRLPCGRCDHPAHLHPQLGGLTAKEKKRGFTRPLMPCTEPGCDCHDYYDMALGLEPNWNPPKQEALAA